MTGLGRALLKDIKVKDVVAYFVSFPPEHIWFEDCGASKG